MIKKRHNRDIIASDIMTKPVVTVRVEDTLHDVACLFTERHIGAAAVLNKNGIPLGVITKTDIVRYHEEKDAGATLVKNGETQHSGFHIVDEEDTVEHWMTPVIFSVSAETPVSTVAERMVKYGTHHIFIRGRSSDDVAGIISSFDILKCVAKKPRKIQLELNSPHL